MKRIKYLRITFGTTYIYLRVKNTDPEPKIYKIVQELSKSYNNVMVRVGDKKKFDK